jgi:methyltransferase
MLDRPPLGAASAVSVISQRTFLGLLGLLIVERIYELWLSRRNARKAFGRGAIEVGRGQYRVMVTFHALFIISCAVEAILRKRGVPPTVSRLALIGEAAAQALRYWSVATLGERWNTRVIVTPNSPPITQGPYAYMRHPNYSAVALEIACVPLIRGLFITATVFSAANALLLAYRIRLEESAMGPLYETAMGKRPRFILRGSSRRY